VTPEERDEWDALYEEAKRDQMRAAIGLAAAAVVFLLVWFVYG